MRKYTKNILKLLEDSEKIITVDGIKTIIKPIPNKNKGMLDYIAYKNFYFGESKEEKFINEVDEAIHIRNCMGSHNYNLNEEEIYTYFEKINVEGRKVGIWRYQPRKLKNKQSKCLIFFHGGGFVGGTTYVVENYCKLIAERINGIVFNIDYSLAPEYKFPCGIRDSIESIKYIYNNAIYFGIDRKNISLAGDSAGATLALSAYNCIKESITIKNLFLLYIGGCICSDFKSPFNYSFDITKFNIPNNESYLMKCINGGIPKPYDKNVFARLYLDRKDVTNPIANPMYINDFYNYPKVVFICPEYDGLRAQAEFLAHRLLEYNNEVLFVLYKGMTHAFIDHLGVMPQAEDSANLISKIILK